MSSKQTFDYNVDLLQSLLWQHNNAHRLAAIQRAKNDWYKTNSGDFWEAWVRDVFDLRTANAFGLKVWAIILDMPLNTVSPPSTRKSWGFGQYHVNFGRGNFGLVGDNTSSLQLEDARLLLRLRYFKLICRPTVPEINDFMKYIFGDKGVVYTVDTNDMRYVIYAFDFAPGSALSDLLKYYDVLPRPAGVGVLIRVGEEAKYFGFGQYHANFNRAPFAPNA